MSTRCPIFAIQIAKRGKPKLAKVLDGTCAAGAIATRSGEDKHITKNEARAWRVEINSGASFAREPLTPDDG